MFSDALAVKTALLHTFSHKRILVVGDVMIDRYIWGGVSRISPEAPVPVVRLDHRSLSLGGAANVASNLASLGTEVQLCGYVGKDDSNRDLRDTCISLGVGVDTLTEIDNFCTITKTRIMVENRQMLRIDEEETTARTEADADMLMARVAQEVGENPPAAVILSDYAKGVCTPYFCQKLITLCREKNISVFVDPKGKDYNKYKGATSVKPNRSEMLEVAQVMGWPTSNIVDAAKRLREHLDLEFVALTLGAQGIAVVQPDGVHEMPTVAREIYDVSGAGDTVIASMVAGIVSGLPLLDAVTLANVAAAQVVARIGSTPVSREDLLVAVQAQSRATGSRKLFTLEELQTLISAWRRQGLRVALTNGCFDLLHAGHVRLLEDSSLQADRLIVAINSDDSVRRIKGEERPLMPQAQRVAVLSALESVDAVVIFEEDAPLQVIQEIRPDILIKGGDYTKESVVGAEFVESYGGAIKLVPIVQDISSSRLASVISKL